MTLQTLLLEAQSRVRAVVFWRPCIVQGLRRKTGLDPWYAGTNFSSSSVIPWTKMGFLLPRWTCNWLVRDLATMKDRVFQVSMENTTERFSCNYNDNFFLWGATDITVTTKTGEMGPSQGTSPMGSQRTVSAFTGTSTSNPLTSFTVFGGMKGILISIWRMPMRWMNPNLFPGPK